MRSLHELVAEVEAAVAALAAAVAEPGFDTSVTDSELHGGVVCLHRAASTLAIGSAHVLARWDARRVWLPGGHRSAASRLSLDTRLSVNSAQRELRRARSLSRLGYTAAAIAAGQLSIDHLDLFARANQPHRHSLFAEHELALIEQCSRLRWIDGVRLVDYWCQRADATGNGNPPSDRSHRAAFYASRTLDGTVAISGTLDPIGGEIVLTELQRIERQLYLLDRSSGTHRTAAQRRAAALVEMARRSATAPAAGRRPQPLFTIHVGDNTAQHLCELASGTVVSPAEVAKYFDDALFETVLFDGPSTVLSISHRRSFTGTLRRAIAARDRHCQHPSGCDVPAAFCDVDHVVPHSEGGTTSQFNGRLQCPTHNRDHARHDVGASPLPERRVDHLETLRARIRWRLLRQPDDPLDDCA